MGKKLSKVLYIFIDESGNFDFSTGGTKHFILTALSTTDPFTLAIPLLKLRYRLLPNYACGQSLSDQGYFHASEDLQEVRNDVFSALIAVENDFRIDAVIVKKSQIKQNLSQQPVSLYFQMGQTLLRKILRGEKKTRSFQEVVIIFSSLFENKKRGILKQSFKSLIKKYAKTPFALYFHNSKFDFCSQIVDYFGWAIYRRWEIKDRRSYRLVKKFIQSEIKLKP